MSTAALNCSTPEGVIVSVTRVGIEFEALH